MLVVVSRGKGVAAGRGSSEGGNLRYSGVREEEDESACFARTLQERGDGTAGWREDAGAVRAAGQR